MQHGYFGTAGVWLLYILGQVIHVALDANSIVTDPAHAVNSYKLYFQTYGARLAARFFLASCVFPLLWDNHTAFDIESFMHSTGSEIGIAGICGYFSDSLWDKAVSFLPWLQKKMPQLPGGAQ